MRRLKIYRSLLLMSILLLLPGLVWAEASIKKVRISKTPVKTRLVFDFKGPIGAHRTFILAKPHRMVIDIADTNFVARLKQSELRGTPIEDIRTGAKNDKNLRIVLDLDDNVKPDVFTLKSKFPFGNRLVVDLYTIKTTKMASKPIPKLTPIKLAPARHPLQDVVVVIDPGHGGKDPGASGRRGSKEKNVVLAISKRLNKVLNGMTGVRSVLTRKGDYYLTLRQRLRVARKDKGDLFVAIHADAFINSKSRGASVFALSQRGASSEAARWLAAKENYSELGEVDLSDKDDLVRSILIDLSQTAIIRESLHLGEKVLGQLKGITKLHRNHVEQARFVVLKSPDIPSILVETGFISNPNEEKRLNSSVYQEKMARSIAIGIRNYFKSNPPKDSFFAALKHAGRHKVRAGESLASIANAYKVNTRYLKKLNHLASGRLRVGQVLLIPTGLD